MTPPALVRVLRGSLVESVHRCDVAIHHAGRTVVSFGDVTSPVFLRSSAKPFQALGFVLSGAADRFGATEEELAIVCASHGAEAIHVDVVQRLLARGGLDPSVLRCGVHAPACTRSAVELARSGGRPAIVHNNCSGKHSGMVLTALHLGLPLESYLDPDHPVQVANRRNLALFAGMDPADIVLGTDGCSAPVFALSLEKAAAAFARFGDPDDVIPPAEAAAARRLASAMMAHPRLVAWTGEGDTPLMAAAPGRILSKLGAEGVQCVACPGLRVGIALKAEDGAARPRIPLTVALLRELGVLDAGQASAVGHAADLEIRNHAGVLVGHMEIALPGPVPGVG